VRMGARAGGLRRWMLPGGVAVPVLVALAAVPALAAMNPGGGASATPVATIAAVRCATGCVGIEAVPPGSVLRLRGKALDEVDQVVFLGAAGPADDVAAPALHAQARQLDVKVPAGAPSGPLIARDVGGMDSDPSDQTVTVGAPPAEQTVTGAPALPVLAATTRVSTTIDAHVAARTVYYGGAEPATLRLTLKGGPATALDVALVRVPDGTVVQRWSTPPLAPGATQAIQWDGKVGSAAPAKASRFQFQVWTAAGSARALAAASEPEAADTFELRPYAFPIVGPHKFGTGMGRFGAGRGGRSHQGQDVFADCGTPLIAARGGTVEFSGFQGAAGNYLVIDADGSSQDMVYMHLRDAPLFDKGEQVDTGEPIGFVGDTGDAQDCHLHFELWTAPGWYTGGQAIDPLATLRSWDVAGPGR
jgi:murein DD-endopeptidase MepM/ murein hydrolase activator NlpD